MAERDRNPMDDVSLAISFVESRVSDTGRKQDQTNELLKEIVKLLKQINKRAAAK